MVSPGISAAYDAFIERQDVLRNATRRLSVAVDWPGGPVYSQVVGVRRSHSSVTTDRHEQKFVSARRPTMTSPVYGFNDVNVRTEPKEEDREFARPVVNREVDMAIEDNGFASVDSIVANKTPLRRSTPR
jgi:hypothetical protein